MLLVKPDFPDERLEDEAAARGWTDRREGAPTLPAYSPGPGLSHVAGNRR
jgi:hypothetical protein